MEGDEALASLIANLRAFGETAAEEVAKEAAPLVEAAVKATAAAGTDPYGKPWPKKKDGGRALPNAASAISADAKGPVVQIKVTGPYAIQNNLKTSRRQVIPDSGAPLPRGVLDALHEGARRAWSKVTGGSG